MGFPAGQRPLAFTVPFTTNWEETTLSIARDVQANGHAYATVESWDAMIPERKALLVEGWHPTDPDYPFQQPYGLQADAAWSPAAEWLAPYLAPAVSNGGLAHVAAVGDIMLSRTLGEAINNGRLAYPFAEVAPLLQAADIAVGNLECALGDGGVPAEKAYTFLAPPAGAQALAMAGFDVITLANNHAMDYGPGTLRQGLDLLLAQGIAPIGAGIDADAAYAPAIREANGLTLAFLGYVNVPVEGRSPFFDTATWTATAESPGLAWGDPGRVAADVAAAQALADHVIVVLHGGYEYVLPPSQEQLDIAHAAIDAGAALVIGHHAHILQGVEFYNGGVIVYGLGNFAFTISGPPETAILNAWLDETGVRQINFIPAVIQTSGQPRLATTEEAPLILDQIYRLTNSLNPR
jgi:poly-gamma-glutamate synthesis protein (capsule biosynthesis protein)